MAIVMQMTWDGVTRAQYDQLRDALGWSATPPAGGLVHTAWFTDAGLRTSDVWESPEAFERFLAQRLMPAVTEIGIGGAPQVTTAPAYAYTSTVVSSP